MTGPRLRLGPNLLVDGSGCCSRSFLLVLLIPVTRERKPEGTTVRVGLMTSGTSSGGALRPRSAVRKFPPLPPPPTSPPTPPPPSQLFPFNGFTSIFKPWPPVVFLEFARRFVLSFRVGSRFFFPPFCGLPSARPGGLLIGDD